MKFEELNAEQQARAIEKCRSWTVDGDQWYEELELQFISKLEEYGFSDIIISFSGFWCQGDGASFTAEKINLEKFLRKNGQWSQYRILHKLIKEDSINTKVQRIDHRYSHECTVSTEIDIDYYVDSTEKQNESCNDLQEDIKSFVQSESIEYYKSLETEYNYRTSDEQVKEMIINNDYDFDEVDNSVITI